MKTPATPPEVRSESPSESQPAAWTRRDILHSAAVAGSAALCYAAAGRVEGADAPSSGGHLPKAKPEELRLDPKRLQVAYDLMEKWTAGSKEAGPKAPVPGGAILVGRFGKTVEPRYFGRQGPEPDAEAIRRDAMFYMASITKPVIYTAGLMLVERGLLNLSDRVSRYVPEFTGPNKDAAKNPEKNIEKNPEKNTIKATAKNSTDTKAAEIIKNAFDEIIKESEITKDDVQVLHLFTHTSGLPDELPRNTELRSSHAPLSKFMEEGIKADLLFRPGTQFSYSSTATLLVADIVQRLSGKTISEFLRTEIIEPLGLKSTALGSKGFARERIVRLTLPEYQKAEYGWNSQYWQEFGSPAGGLLSTPEDYAVICALVLNGGEWNGVRLLSKAMVARMTTNRYNDLPDMPEATRRTQPWGLGWRLNHPSSSDSWGDLLNSRVFGHTGSAGNLVWMDPHTQGFCILFSNYLRARAPWRLVHLSNIIASAFV